MKVWESLQNGEAAVNERGESLYLQHLLADSELVGLLSRGGDSKDSKSVVDSSKAESKSGEAIIRECFDFGYYTKNVDSIFKRVFGE